ncbi:MAG: hypothetical protein J2P48_07025 [Alphaproteobacteria bacterium]|nr:hypothetical protein [Alphaproteobacteria bacterium]
MTDVSSGQQQQGLVTHLKITDRAARLGGGWPGRQCALPCLRAAPVSTIYPARYQYQVVMELASGFWQSPESLHQISISTREGPISGPQAALPLGDTVIAKDAAQHGNSSYIV